jgi:hypothetical protein
MLQPTISKRAKRVKEATNTVFRIGTQLVQDKKTAVLAAAETSASVTKASVVGKDLLTAVSKCTPLRGTRYL